MRICIYMLVALGVLFSSSLAGDDVESKSALANDVVKIQMNSLTWARLAYSMTFAADAGIPVEKLQSQFSQDALKSLPSHVLEALKQGSRAIPAWAECVNDTRSTGIRESDLLNGQVSENAPFLTCQNVALTMLSILTPSEKVKRLQGKNAKSQLRDIAIEWGKHIEKMPPGEIIRERLKFAGRRDKFFLLGFVYESRLAEAYPVIEAYYLEQAKDPDTMFFLEITGFFRHRRRGAAELLKQVEATLPKNLMVREIDELSLAYFKNAWSLLTRYDNMDSAIKAWNSGTCSDHDLTELVTRSVDMPWVGHSLPVDPVEIHVPVMEENFISLVRSAHQQPDFRKRLFLLQLANSAQSMMKDIREHSRFRNDPVQGITSDRWKPTSDLLKDMMEDPREVVADGRQMTSPAVESAKIIWEGWGPMSRRTGDDQGQPTRDWRQDAIREFRSDPSSVILPAARDLIAHPDAFLPEWFPVDEQPKLYLDVYSGTAAEIRKKIHDLPWRSKLLVVSQAQKNPESLASIESQFMQFVDWQTEGGSVDLQSFDSTWKEKLQGHSLGVPEWEALKSWVQVEAQAKGYWVITGESTMSCPGITLRVRSARKEDRHEVVIVAARTSLVSQRERYLVLPDSVKRISLDEWDEKYEVPELRSPNGNDYEKSLPLPEAAIQKLVDQGGKGTGNNFDLGLFFEIGVIPFPKDRVTRE